VHIDFKNIITNVQCSFNEALLSLTGGKLFLFYSSLPDASGGGFQGAECNYFLEKFVLYQGGGPA